MTQEREIEVVEQILNGNKALYEEIVRAYQENVVNLCYRLAGNSIDVEEATQRVFVELYVALPRFRHESKLSSFIYRITVNVVWKMLKRKKRMIPMESEWMQVIEQRSVGDESLVKNEEERKMIEAIGKLGIEQRTALVLYAFKGFTYNDVSEVMGISLSKVASLLYRAKNNLRKLMENNTD